MNKMNRSTPLEKKAMTVQSIFGCRASLPWLLGLVSIILVVCAISPVMAGEKIMTGRPELNANIAGTN